MDSQPKLSLLFTRQELETAVSQLAAKISTDYRDKHPVLVGVLKGSFIFMADLIRLLDFPLEVEFVRLYSYGVGRESSGKIEMVHDLRSVIKNRHVLVIEDIVDTGLTISFLLDYLRKKKPASLKLCSLTDKPSRRKVPVTIDYLGVSVPDKFVVGYGLDLDEKFRNLPDMHILQDNG